MKEKINIGSSFYMAYQDAKSHKWHLMAGKIKCFLDKDSSYFISEKDIEYNLRDRNIFIDEIKARRFVLNKNNKLAQNSDDISDGYHTFGELYEQRTALLPVMVSMIPEFCAKSKFHHDGSMYDGMFIVGIKFPNIAPITYHLENRHWDKIHCQELEKFWEWDQSTPTDCLKRLEQLNQVLFQQRINKPVPIASQRRTLPLNNLHVNQ